MTRRSLGLGNGPKEHLQVEGDRQQRVAASPRADKPEVVVDEWVPEAERFDLGSAHGTDEARHSLHGGSLHARRPGSFTQPWRWWITCICSEGPEGDDEAVLAYMSRSALWRAVDQEDWMIWSGELVDELSSTPEAANLLLRFKAATGLTVDEWWLRGLCERATRHVHGARSWGGAAVNQRIDDAWARLVVAPLADTVQAARNALTRERSSTPPQVPDPFDLHWLATRPIVETPDGRRFQLWLGANNRSLLPAAIAQTVADTIGGRYYRVSFALGRAAERRLTRALDDLPDVDGDHRIPESAMPVEISKCDYLLEHGGLLLGIDFTLATPSRALASGTKEAVAAFIEKVSGKFAQVYSSFRWRDPAASKRWLPLVVFVSPTVVDPLLNERVHERLVSSGRAPAADSELMTAGVPELLDLIEHSRQTGRCLVELVREWRDGPQRGSMLDWWLADRNALRSSGKQRIGAISDRAASVLAPPGSH